MFCSFTTSQIEYLREALDTPKIPIKKARLTWEGSESEINSKKLADYGFVVWKAPNTVLLKEGEEMLYIRMEDDGVGFPEQVMQYMNFESEDPSREGHHVGLWNIKRTMEVLYQKRELIHLSNLETGGCLIEIWIPKTTAVGEEQEIKNERIDRG
jgi:hypothetical protein